MANPAGRRSVPAEEVRARSVSGATRKALISVLEAQLGEVKKAKKWNECHELKERIDQMKKVHGDISRLKEELEAAEVVEDFEACNEIEQRVNDLKVKFSRQVLLWASGAPQRFLCRLRTLQCIFHRWALTKTPPTTVRSIIRLSLSQRAKGTFRFR